jgi:lauroyl/myristoyl acyltransferase
MEGNVQSHDPPFTRSLAPGADRAGERPRWYVHSYNRAELYRLAAALSRLPRPARLALARWIGRRALRFLPVERAVTRTSLAVMTGAAGPRLDALAAELFAEFAMLFGDLVAASRQPVERLCAHVGRRAGAEHLDRLDGPVISLTAHVGNWDLAGRLLARNSARPTHVVVAEEEMRALETWLRRDGDGIRFVARSRPTVSLELLAALRRGEIVALQGDRALGNRGDVLVPFFGRPAPFPIGPFRLASASGAPVAPAFCTLGPDRRYTIRMLEPLVVKRGDEEGALRAWVAILEGIVRERPTQWFNFFDIWNPFGVPGHDGQPRPGAGEE